MPNWCENKLTISADKKIIKEIKQKIFTETEVDDYRGQQGKGYYFDFDKVIPMPESLNVQSGSAGLIGTKLLTSKPDELVDEGLCKNFSFLQGKTNVQAIEMAQQDENLSECIKIGQIYIDNLKKYGAKDWYDWRNINWDTKWNSDSFVSQEDFESMQDDIEFFFNTAWSPPESIIHKLIALYPTAQVYMKFWEPGMCFWGVISSNNEDSFCDSLEENANNKQVMFDFAEDDFGICEEDFNFEPS